MTTFKNGYSLPITIYGFNDKKAITDLAIDYFNGYKIEDPLEFAYLTFVAVSNMKASCKIVAPRHKFSNYLETIPGTNLPYSKKTKYNNNRIINPNEFLINENKNGKDIKILLGVKTINNGFDDKIKKLHKNGIDIKLSQHEADSSIDVFSLAIDDGIDVESMGFTLYNDEDGFLGIRYEKELVRRLAVAFQNQYRSSLDLTEALE